MKLSGLLLLVVSTSVFAGIGPNDYPSAEAAAHAAGRLYYQQSASEDREFIGGIIRFGVRYTYTVTAGDRGADQVRTTLRLPSGSALVAVWHTHGSPHSSRKYFSAVDTKLVTRLGLPFYLMDPSGKLRVFSPGDSTLSRLQTRRLGLGNQAGYARGHQVFKP
jgi:hypothetical protein